jgi:hypothetical protein
VLRLKRVIRKIDNLSHLYVSCEHYVLLDIVDSHSLDYYPVLTEWYRYIMYTQHSSMQLFHIVSTSPLSFSDYDIRQEHMEIESDAIAVPPRSSPGRARDRSICILGSDS